MPMVHGGRAATIAESCISRETLGARRLAMLIDAMQYKS
jgi:hypothetical protein